MTWKILFVIATVLISLVITAIIIFLMNIIGYNTDYFGISGLEYAILLLQVNIAFILGILYSLGWKQQLFSKKTTNIFLTIFVISMILSPIIFVFPAMYSLWNDPTDLTTKDTIFISIICSIIIAPIIALIVSLFLIPFYIGLYKYKKNFDALTLVNKPYRKILSLYCVPILAGFVITVLTKYSHFAQYNLIDFCAIASCVYEIIFMIGFAWDIRIYNKLFWQITSIPYVLLMLMTPFLISDTFNKDFHIKEILLNTPIAIVFSVILSVIFIFVIYKYAYKDEF